MTFENVYLDFGTKMPKMPVFAQNEAPLNSPEPPHMGGLPPTLAPPYGGAQNFNGGHSVPDFLKSGKKLIKAI